MIDKTDFYAKHHPRMLKIFEKSCLGIAGCGGLGSNAAVSLARAGIGHLILVDFDRIEPSNLNRQYFFTDQIGQFKSKALKDNILKINPFIRIDEFSVMIKEENVDALFSDCDILIEAFDQADQKIMLIETWLSLYPQKPIICGSGVAGIGNNNKIHVSQHDNFYICGDEECELEAGITPFAPKVGIVANMQANQALELLINQNKEF
jgi:sulfur carrier protein ThiS adenylyltransferase